MHCLNDLLGVGVSILVLLLCLYINVLLGFFINIPIGAACALMLAFIHLTRETYKKKTKFRVARARLLELDLVGSLFFASVSTMLVLAITWGGTSFPWKSSRIIGLFCGSFGSACAFLVWERHRGDRASLPLSSLQNPIVLFSCFTVFFQIGGLLLLTFYLPIWFQVVQNVRPIASGVRTLPAVISEGIDAVTSGAFS